MRNSIRQKIVPWLLLLAIACAPIRTIPGVGHRHALHATLTRDASGTERMVGETGETNGHRHDVDLTRSTDGAFRGWVIPARDKHHHGVDIVAAGSAETVEGYTEALPVRLPLAEVFLAVAILLWVIFSTRSAWMDAGRFLPVSGAAMIVWMALSAIVNKSGWTGFSETIKLAFWMALAVPIFADAARYPVWRRRAVIGLLVGTGVTLIAAAAQYFSALPDSAVAGFLGAANKSGRHHLGAYLAMAAPVLFAVACRRDTACWILRLCSAIAVAASLALNLSGGATLALVLGVLVTAACMFRPFGLTITAAVLGLIILAADLLPNRAHGTILARTLAVHVTNPKTGKYVPTVSYKRLNAELEAIRDRPVWGLGPGRYTGTDDDISRYYIAPNLEPDGRTDDVLGYNITTHEPDSYTLALSQLACVAGIPALLFFLALLVGGISRAMRASQPDAWSQGAAGSLASVGLVSFFTSPAVLGVGCMLAALLGVAAAEEPPTRAVSTEPLA